MQNPEEIKQLIRLPNEKAWLTNKVKVTLGGREANAWLHHIQKTILKGLQKEMGATYFGFK